MAVQIRQTHRLEWSGSEEHPSLDKDGSRSWRRSRWAELPAGEELDRQIERRVFGRVPGRSVPPFSTEDWTAVALAELVSRQTGWWFDVVERDGTWEAMWIELPPPGGSEHGSRRRILTLVTATASTRALAICRSLVKATACPRWRGAIAETAAPRISRS